MSSVPYRRGRLMIASTASRPPQATRTSASRESSRAASSSSPVGIDHRHGVGQQPPAERLARGVGIGRLRQGAASRCGNMPGRAARDLHQIGVLAEHRLHQATACPARARCPPPNVRPGPAAGRGRKASPFRPADEAVQRIGPAAERAPQRASARLARRSHSGKKPSRPAWMKSASG